MSPGQPEKHAHQGVLVRPQRLRGIEIPTVRNIHETALFGDQFGAVLTSGPDQYEVDFGFDNHRTWTFEDTNDPDLGPQLSQVEELVFWGATQVDLLIHCHAGMSRSTAAAWGVAIARGLDAHDSLVALRDAHPFDYIDQEKRWFCPNRLLVEHLQTIFADDSLLAIRQDVVQSDPRSRWLHWH